MAKTALTTTDTPELSADSAGIAPTSATAARGTGATGRPNTFRNTGRTHLRITNSNQTAAATNAYVTVRSREKSNQGKWNHPVINVPKNATRIAGPFPVGRFGATAELYYTSNAPTEGIKGDGANGFKEDGTLADLGTELTATQAGELTVEVLG